MSGDPIKKVVIVGGGTAGWVTAAVLTKTLTSSWGISGRSSTKR